MYIKDLCNDSKISVQIARNINECNRYIATFVQLPRKRDEQFQPSWRFPIGVGRYARKCRGSWPLPGRQTLVSTVTGTAGGLRGQFLQATSRCEILNFLYLVTSSLPPRPFIPFLTHSLSFSLSPIPISSPTTFLALYYIDNFHPRQDDNIFLTDKPPPKIFQAARFAQPPPPPSTPPHRPPH